MRVLDPIRVQRVDDGSLTALLQKYRDRAQRQNGKIQAQVARDAWRRTISTDVWPKICSSRSGCTRRKERACQIARSRIWEDD